MIPDSQDSIKLLSSALIKKVKNSALISPRKRMNFNFHSSLEDSVHRFLNVFTANTYIRPHRHLEPPKSETFVVLSGAMAFFIFDRYGNILECHKLESLSGSPSDFAEKNGGIDIMEGIWHTLIPITQEVVCFEVKKGPYQPISDKEFASWAPREGDAEVRGYLNILKKEALHRLKLEAAEFQW